jgi:hypothetical protein
MDRVEREADGPVVTVLRPKGGWIRQQLRYLVPAAAAAALVAMVVRYSGMTPGTPTPTAPQAVSERAAPDPAGERRAKAEPESDGQGWPSGGAGRDATGSVPPARATEKSESAAAARLIPPPVPARDQLAAVSRVERDRWADRSLPAGNVEASRDRSAAPAAVSVPSPPPMTHRGDSAGSPPVTAADGMPSGLPAERKKMAGAADQGAEQHVAGKAKSAAGMRIAKESSPGSPCEHARTLAEWKRFRDAEDAQRACLAGDLDAPSLEKGLVFLAELLDRQARFAEADAVIADVDRQFPQSRPLDLYRQQRPMVQMQPMTAPGFR